MQKRKRELPVLVDGDDVVTRTLPVLTDDDGEWVTLETAVGWENEHRKLVADAMPAAAPAKGSGTNPKH